MTFEKEGRSIHAVYLSISLLVVRDLIKSVLVSLVLKTVSMELCHKSVSQYR